MTKIPIYTIGYGNRSMEAFVELLQRYEIRYLVDVRSQPYSRFNSQFSKDAFEKNLRRHTIRYMFMGDTLGGQPKDDSCYVNGKVDYAKLCKKLFYQEGIDRLRVAWEKQLYVAVMCAELKPQECHRSKLIGNTLMEQHIDVKHIDENGRTKIQQEVNDILLKGQPPLFDQSLLELNGQIGVSRKKHAPSDERAWMSQKIVTIGVYGFNKERFFQALLDANVDMFCDIRLRRGMRGSEYTFVNSQRLQEMLKELGIRYMYAKELAPSKAVRDRQEQEDKKHGIAKRVRLELGQSFIQTYETECLSHFNSQAFIEQLGPDVKVMSLFCVECEPNACHRSLVARKLAQDLGLQVEHITA